MSLPRAQILPDRISVSDETLDVFSDLFREAAREQDLTTRQTCRYEAWALAFVAWCREESGRRGRAEEIDAFRRALRNRAKLGEETISEAMDALAFLFGAAQGAKECIASSGRKEETNDAEAHADQESLPRKDILSLQTRWQNETGSSEDDTSSSTVSGSRATSSKRSPSDDSSRAEHVSDSASTAEHCIQRFQTQLDAVHSPSPDAE